MHKLARETAWVDADARDSNTSSCQRSVRIVYSANSVNYRQEFAQIVFVKQMYSISTLRIVGSYVINKSESHLATTQVLKHFIVIY